MPTNFVDKLIDSGTAHDLFQQKITEKQNVVQNYGTVVDKAD